MSKNIFFELFLIASVALVWIPGASALQQYQDAYNSTFSTNASCSICHINSANGGPLTPYGMQFKNQTNYQTDPGSALIAIGQASVMTPGATTTATSMVTATSTATSTDTLTATATLTETPIATDTSTETPIATEPTLIATPESTEIPPPIETPITTAPAPTPTPSTPGFGLGVLIAGLLACYFILKRHNN